MRAQILDLFASYPAAHERLLDMLVELASCGRGEPGGRERLAAGKHPGDAVACGDVPCYPLHRHLLPAARVGGSPRISVVVRLTVTRPEFSADMQALELLEALPVRVRVDAPGFALLNAAEQETAILPDADSPPLVFDLRPERIGHTRVTFDLFQGGNPVGAASVPMEIVAHEVDEAPEPRPGQGLRTEPAARRPTSCSSLRTSGTPTSRG